MNVTESEITARLSVVKEKSASNVPLVRYGRLSIDVNSPVDLWVRWSTVRGTHDRFLALPGESLEWLQRSLTDALLRQLSLLGLSAPIHGNYTSHSLRIGAHTEQLLLVILLEVRLSLFSWVPRSQEMSALYFDRTIDTSPATFWFFGASDVSHSSTARSLVPASTSQ